jgi:hypothetical protein
MSGSTQQSTQAGPSWGGSWPHLAALAGRGGHIVFGYVAPIQGVAVATEGTRVHATLLRGEGETFDQVLARLDAAIGESLRTGAPVNELAGAEFVMGSTRERPRKGRRR